MAVIVQRSSAELRRLTDARWNDTFYITAYLADLGDVATPPDEASSFATWDDYFNQENHPFYGTRPISVTKTPGASVYNTTNFRAEVPSLSFAFTSTVLQYVSGIQRATHVVFADYNDNIIAVGELDPPELYTDGSSFTFTLDLWGQYAT